MILFRFNLVAIVSAQAISILIKRILSYKAIYAGGFKQCLQGVKAQCRKEILKPIYPNAVKVGLTGLGGFCVTRSAIIIGSLYLPLGEIASYGITIQIISILASVAAVYFSTYQPKIVQYRVQNDNAAIKHLYLRGCFLQFFTYITGGLGLLFLGNWALQVIGSQTPLLSISFIVLALFIYFLETNHSIAGQFLLTKNEVPFFKAALTAGGITLILLFLFFKHTDLGVFGMILAPGIAQACYQNWKWPAVVINELKIKKKDIYNSFDSIKSSIKI
jgi:O-antigen/teichoic acid export membrane protein